MLDLAMLRVHAGGRLLRRWLLRLRHRGRLGLGLGLVLRLRRRRGGLGLSLRLLCWIVRRLCRYGGGLLLRRLCGLLWDNAPHRLSTVIGH